MTDMDPELIGLHEQVVQLSQQNLEEHQQLHELSQGRWGYDGNQLVLMSLIQTLEDEGILTGKQILQFQLRTQMMVRDIINQGWEAYREAKSKQNFVVAQKPTTLLGPDGQPIRG